jgi:GGDEF domain-containing protein
MSIAMSIEMAQRPLATAAALVSSCLAILALAVGGVAFWLAASALGLCAYAFSAPSRRRIAMLEEELTRLRRAATVDSATALGNRHAFTEDLDRELLRADRTGSPICLVVLNVESEPWEGPLADDRRRTSAEAMISAVRRVDRGYRIGVDEFALILPDTRARGGFLAASRAAAALLGAGPSGALCTAGLAEAGPGIDRRQLFRNAYVALLAAGRNGHPSILVYSPELEPERAETTTEGIVARDRSSGAGMETDPGL